MLHPRALAHSPKAGAAPAWVLAAVLGVSGSCSRPDGVDAGSPPPEAGDAGHLPAQDFISTGVRRLSREEIRNTLDQLLGSTPGADMDLLPADSGSTFDTDYTVQAPSAALVQGIKLVAERAAARLRADLPNRERVVGCHPAGPDDAVCLKQFIGSFGRLALRRPLAPDEIDRYAALQSFAISDGDFYAAVELVVRALLQSPEFLYLIEIGTPASGSPGLLKLGGFEIASRLSFLLWGSAPDNALLDAAAQGLLDDPIGIQSAAVRMLDDPRAHRRAVDFHAQWLGYRQTALPPDLEPAMQRETAVLVERSVYDPSADWFDLFRAMDTYVDDTLAAHYGLSPRGLPGAGWVSYQGTDRMGILSQGTFLSVNSKFGDTSPTRRGLLVRRKLLCQDIPPPPPNVNVDNPPPGGGAVKCKQQRYEAHSVGACAGCHAQLDPIGFGLENYDQTGAFRTHDAGDPDCPIAGQGKLSELGDFHGPGGLGRLLIQSGDLDRCMITQYYRFATGRTETQADTANLAALTERFREHGQHFNSLVLDFVGSRFFRYRVAE